MTCRNHRNIDDNQDPPIHPDHDENPLATAEAGIVSIIIAALAIVALVLALVG